MYRVCFAFVLSLAAPFAVAQASDAFSGKYSAITARAPDQSSVLQLTHRGGNAYAIDLQIVAPNATRHTGHIQGEGLREGDTITLVKENRIPETGKIDHPPQCVLTLRVAGSVATVLSEKGCAAHHGAAASFVEQGAKLIRD